MAQTETRHAERGSLFKLLIAKETGDINSQIYAQRATMEKEDVDSVMAEFEEWKKNRK